MMLVMIYVVFLKTAPWGTLAKPVVGSSGGEITDDPSCGGGNPKVFTLALTDWVDKNHQWLGAVLAILMITELFTAMCSYGLYEQLKSEGTILPKDQKRPWADDKNQYVANARF